MAHLRAKNAALIEKAWVGQLIAPGTFYQIEDDEIHRWRINLLVHTDIALGLLVINDGTNDLSPTDAELALQGNYHLSSVVPFVTTSITDILIPSMSLTPAKGTYLVIYNASIVQSNSTASNIWSVFKANLKIADSERTQRAPSSNAPMVQSTHTLVVVDGTQTVDVRTRTSTGTVTINARSFTLIKIGD